MSKKNPSVLWSVDQSLDASEKAKARENIGVSLDNNAAGDPTLTFVTGKKVDSSTGVVTLNTAKVKVSNTYSSTGTDPVNGKAIADALDDLKITEDSSWISDNQFVKYVTQADGQVTQVRSQPTIANVDGLTTRLSNIDTAISGIYSYSAVKDGSNNTISTLSRNSTLTINGSGGVTVTADTTNQKLIISSDTINDGELKIKLDNGTAIGTGFTANSQAGATFNIPAASYSGSTYSAGLMTGADKEKLDNMSSITSAGTDLTISNNIIKVNTTGNDYKSSVYYSFVTGSDTHTTHAYSFAGGYNSIAGGFTKNGSDYTPSTSNSAGGKNGDQTMFAYGTNCRVNMCDAFAIGVNNTILDTGPGNNGNTSSAWYGETGSGILGSTNSITDAYHSIIIGNNNHVDHTHHHNILIGTYLGSVLGNTIVMGHHNDSCSQAPGLNWNAVNLARITGYGEAQGGTSYVARNIEELHAGGLLWTRIGFTASAVSTISDYTDWINDTMAFVDTSTTIPKVRTRSLDYTDANNFEELAISMTHTTLQVGYNSLESGVQEAAVVKLLTLDNVATGPSGVTHTYRPVLEFVDIDSDVTSSRGIVGLGQYRNYNPATNGQTNGGSGDNTFGILTNARLKLYAARTANGIDGAALGNLVTGTISVRYVLTSKLTSSHPLIASAQLGELTFIYNDSIEPSTKIYICDGDATPNEYTASSYVTYGKFTILMTTTATTYSSGAITSYGKFAKIGT